MPHPNTHLSASTKGGETPARGPKWLRAREWILAWIVEKDLAPGSPLPSVQKICEDSRFKVQPVRRAMDELARSGMVRRRAGAPTVLLEREARFVDPGFSFSAGGEVRTKVVEVTRRSARSAGEWMFEQDARTALGLGSKDEFLVIARLRTINGRPRALHRSYLNPAHFPSGFLGQHDFETESLIAAFNHHGYRVDSRDTTLTARFPTEEERSLLVLEDHAVLCADQEMRARTEDDQIVTVEFMRACYVDWKYRITNRTAK